jgi:hypothetical protein
MEPRLQIGKRSVAAGGPPAIKPGVLPGQNHLGACQELEGTADFRKIGALVLWLWLLVAGLSAANTSRAQSVSHEYQLKAVFLLNFAHLTDWPTNALTDPGAPFVIGILGGDPFGGDLDGAIRGEYWNGHPVVVQRYPRREDLQNCQILFISQPPSRQLPAILAGLKGKPVLTVTDLDSPAADAVGVQFRTENNKIRFRINLGSLQDAGLTMSSKLLRVAEIVPAQNQ